MAIAPFYHQQAEQARREAMAEPLERRRMQHLQSASRWDELAREADELDYRKRLGSGLLSSPLLPQPLT